jgi:hypothetical protein
MFLHVPNQQALDAAIQFNAITTSKQQCCEDGHTSAESDKSSQHCSSIGNDEGSVSEQFD